MANYRSNLVDLSVAFLYHTDKAVLVTDGSKEVWIPKSMCETEPADLDSLGRGEMIELTCEERIAIEKGLA